MTWANEDHGVKAYLGRRYRLSASHRLHADALSDAENHAMFGKCNNPHGHGHNYVIEVTVGGPVDAKTGMVCDLAALDACVLKEVVEPFDHMNLNTLECFRDRVPTTENLCMEVHRRLQSALTMAELVRVCVEETSNNFFEYRDGAKQPGRGGRA
jgi:6-pyruvoyltetrahydropterin/6-carboxytetrahydropterin synthase